MLRALVLFAVLLTPSRARACGAECATDAGALLPFLFAAGGIFLAARVIGGLRQRATERKLGTMSQDD